MSTPYATPTRSHRLTISLFAIAVIVGCGKPPEQPAPFRNVDAEYVGSAACFDCHEDEWRGYQSHGMANSVYEMTEKRLVEAFPAEPLLHEGSGLYYRAFREGDRFLQEEYELDASGAKVHSLVREMKYVVGSGTAARTYLTESDGRLFEMPLTWYTQNAHWNFSPGYATQSLRFDRWIPDRCMACHNSYPESVPHVPGKYTNVPTGIGCERCHGPGSLHVEARLESPDVVGEVDSTIVNPEHLPLDLRLDVCQQCHLNGTVSILREGRSAFDFRPSQALADYMALFTTPAASEGEIDVISHADRMKQSPCFLESQATSNPMDCTTCHDPHRGFRDLGPAYFNETCISCHALEPLQSAVGAEWSDEHTAATNCFSCHMPRVEAEDAPHASFTDHFIRVVEDEVEPVTTDAGGGLIAYFDRDRSGIKAGLYQGIAHVVQGRQTGSVAEVERGIDLLRAALEQVPDSSGSAHFHLGLALQKIGRASEAVEPLEESVRRDADDPERLNALAQAYEGTGEQARTIEQLYRRALAIQPALADVRVNLGRFLEAQGRSDEAMQAYREALEEHPWLATAHYNLGTAHLRRGELVEARRSLVEAIRLDPFYVEARGNLGLLHLQVGEEREALAQFQAAVRHAPEHPVALANLGTYYLNNGRLEEATALLERAVLRDPNYATAYSNLALAYLQLNRVSEARAYAQRALRLAPNDATARSVLDAANR